MLLWCLSISLFFLDSALGLMNLAVASVSDNALQVELTKEYMWREIRGARFPTPTCARQKDQYVSDNLRGIIDPDRPDL